MLLPAQSATALNMNGRESSEEIQSLLDNVLAPTEQDLRPAIVRALLESDPSKGIDEIDAVVAQLSEQSLTRIVLLTQRASLKVLAGDVLAGRADFESLLRQFPQADFIRLQAIESLAYGYEADFAARQWIDIAATNPAAARAISGYTMGALNANLEAKGSDRSKLALLLALDRIRYDPGTTALRNSMQLAIFTNAANDSGREAEALGALRKLTDPELLLSIATQSSYRNYWRYIELDAASLDARGAKFLHELERDFIAAENGEAAGKFLSAATDFGDAKVVASEYSRLLDRLLEQSGDSTYAQYDTPFWVPAIATAWVAAGDTLNAEEQFKSGLKQYANISGTNDLNISANYALLLLDLGRPREALALIDPAIDELALAGEAAKALAQMHAVRLRAYYLLGDLTKAQDSLRELDRVRGTLVDVFVNAMLMIDDEDQARGAIIAGLRSGSPEQAISVLQYPLARPSSDMEAAYEEKLDRLRHDPKVLNALQEVGRIVPVSPIDAGPFDHSATVEAFPSLL
jgi:hypothetical protein